MKSKFLFIFSLLIGLNITAQTNGINYKAIIKDINGNVVANSTIDVIFKIDEASTNIFSEYHTTTSDNNGFIILNIGEGTTTIGDFTTINWTTNNHFLNVQVGIDGGAFVDLGTTAFKAVPYAYKALKADNVTGLEKISESGLFGWRLVGQDETLYGDIGGGAIDLSFSGEATDTNGATGLFSFASGINTHASGSFSTAMGQGTAANGESSTSTGENTIASGGVSLATGFQTEAIGIGSVSFGDRTKANGGFTMSMGVLTNADAAYSVVLGKHNIGGGNPSQWVETDPLFEIGNGTNSVNTNNALTVLKNGSVLAPTFDISEIIDPKALITKEYAEANIVSTGLENITETSSGWRFVGRNAANYADIGGGAVDMSVSSEGGDINGASGDYSIASGFNTLASGGISAAFGFDTTSSGNISSSFGLGTIAESYAETVVGTYDTNYFEDNDSGFHEFDRAFVVGNGESDSNRSDALIVNKNGTVLAPSMDISEIIGDKMLITKEYADNNLTPSGLQRITDGLTGWRLIGYDPLNYGILGQDAVDLSISSNPSSFKGARGNKSFASGSNSTALGSNSTAMGINTNAEGNSSFAVGTGPDATGFASVAMGANTIASGSYSTAIGQEVTAPSYSEFAIGYWNTNYTPTNPTSPNTNDRLFVIGNGSNNNNRKNALTLLKNGRLGLETETPDVKLHITGGGDASLANGSGYFIMGNVTGANMVFDENEIIARNNGVNSPLYLQNTGGNVAIGAVNPSVALDIVGSIEYTGTITDVSDKRLKENFTSIDTVLERLQKIQGYTYNMKDDVDKKREYGVIAQDLQKVFPEMVSVIDTENQYLGVSYIQLIPVLLEAIKEQHEIIDNQNKTITGLSVEMSELKSLKIRMQHLEALLSVKVKESKK